MQFFIKPSIQTNMSLSQFSKYGLYFIIPFFSYTLFTFNKIETLWPGTQVIAGILAFKDLMTPDLLINSLIESPYKYTIYFLSFILPNSIKELIIFYKTYSVFQSTISLFTTILIIIKIIKFYYPSIEFNNVKAKFLISAITLIYLIPSSIYIENNFLVDFFSILKPISLAGWPMSVRALNPSGISFIIINIAFIYFTKTKRLNPLIIFLILLSTLIHPVIPLLFLLYMILLIIGSGPKEFLKEFICSLFAILIVWSFHILGETSNSNIFFDAYLTRHKHHYLVSEIINIKSFKHYMINSLLSLIVFILSKFLKKNYFIIFKLIVFDILFTVSILLFQFYFIEIVKSQSVLIAGLPRLLMIHGVIYYIIILILLLKVSFKIKTFKSLSQSFKFIINTKFYKMFVICSIFLAINIFNYEIKFKSLVNDNELVDFFNSKKIYNYQLIDDVPSESGLRIREFYKSPVYHDNYFPFNIENVSEWVKRKEKVRNAIDDGVLFENENIYLISSKEHRFKNIGLVNLQGKKYRVYSLNKP